MSKFALVELLKEYGFSDSDILYMFVYWIDVGEVENCINDFLNDRDLAIEDNCIVSK